MRLRPHPLIVAAALVLGACSAKTPGSIDYGDGSEPGPSRSTPASATSGPRSGPAQPARANPTAQPRATGGLLQTSASYLDDGGVGQMALSYLRASPGKRLIVEIDYVERRRPDEAARAHLESILQRETDKPGGISVRIDDEIPQERTAHTFADIDDIERRFRDDRSRGDTATMWIVYLNGHLSGESGTLGVAFRASGAALFKDDIEDAATALVSEAAIERSVLTHEAGHLLALVNIGYKSRHDHEDERNRGHSKSRASVMYWAIEDISVAALLSGGPADDFDADDRDDLAMLREGS